MGILKLGMLNKYFFIVFASFDHIFLCLFHKLLFASKLTPYELLSICCVLLRSKHKYNCEMLSIHRFPLYTSQ